MVVGLVEAGDRGVFATPVLEFAILVLLVGPVELAQRLESNQKFLRARSCLEDRKGVSIAIFGKTTKAENCPKLFEFVVVQLPFVSGSKYCQINLMQPTHLVAVQVKISACANTRNTSVNETRNTYDKNTVGRSDPIFGRVGHCRCRAGTLGSDIGSSESPADSQVRVDGIQHRKPDGSRSAKQTKLGMDSG